MANRVLLFGLSLSVAGGVAIASWAGRGSAPAPTPRRVAASRATAPAAEWVDLGDDPVTATGGPPPEEARPTTVELERLDPRLDDDLREVIERANWCGTGTLDSYEGRMSFPEPLEDDSLRVRVVNDVAWNTLLAELRKTARAAERLALIRAFLVDRARSASREDVAALARDLASIDAHRRLARRLDLAAEALVESADDVWLAYLDPPSSPPPPSSARPSVR